MHLNLTLLAFVGLSLMLSGAVRVLAQDDPAGVPCERILEALWTVASDACVGGPEGFVCNGGSPPIADPVGPVSNALASVGALVDAQDVAAMRTPIIDVERNVIGVAWLRLPPPLSTTALMLGDVTVWNVASAGFPPWQSMVVVTSDESPTCPAAPLNTLILQSRLGQTARLVVNGISLSLNGTVAVRTSGNRTIFAELSGSASVIVLGLEQEIQTGQQVSVAHPEGDFTRPVGTVPEVALLDPLLPRHLPVALFDRPILLPQPGFLVTQGEVNLRSAPAVTAGVITPIPPGEVLTVLGAHPSGDWYHVRRATGETGWMLRDLLVGTLGQVAAVYESTPTIPQRYGDLGTTGRIQAPAGASLRVGPDAGFRVITTVADGTPVRLLARSPYSPWVQVDTGTDVGWVALIALETRAYVDAIPINWDVPTPPPTPTPTRIPGSFDNAFPEPGTGG